VYFPIVAGTLWTGIELGVVLCETGEKSREIFNRFPVSLPQPSELGNYRPNYHERSTSYDQSSYDPARVPSGGGDECMQHWRFGGGVGRLWSVAAQPARESLAPERVGQFTSKLQLRV